MSPKIRSALARVKKVGAARVDVAELAERVAVLEEEVQECRQLNLRLAELTDLVQELLLPVAQRDEEKVAEMVRRYAAELG